MKDELDTLEFGNPVFTTGLNVTVRQGDKWYGQSGSVDVLAAGSGPSVDRFVGRAMIQGTLNLYFDDIPSGLLTLEHDPACRSKRGLKAELKRVYGYGESFEEDFRFSQKSWTVIFFKPLADFNYHYKSAVSREQDSKE